MQVVPAWQQTVTPAGDVQTWLSGQHVPLMHLTPAGQQTFPQTGSPVKLHWQNPAPPQKVPCGQQIGPFGPGQIVPLQHPLGPQKEPAGQQTKLPFASV